MGGGVTIDAVWLLLWLRLLGGVSVGWHVDECLDLMAESLLLKQRFMGSPTAQLVSAKVNVSGQDVNLLHNLSRKRKRDANTSLCFVFFRVCVDKQSAVSVFGILYNTSSLKMKVAVSRGLHHCSC